MTVPAYETFILLITQAPQGYQARVIASPVGDAAAVDFDLPQGWEELGDALWRRGETANAADLGRHLYDAVFAGEVGASLVRNLERADGRLRIALRLDKGLAALAALPWEFLYSSHLQRYLAPSVETPFVRYLEVAQGGRMQPVAPPLVVLGVLSNPSGVKSLDVEGEWARVQEAVAELGSGQIRLERVAATWSALQERLRRGGVHVLHFIGHGVFDAETNQGSLVFEDDAGQPTLVSADHFKVLMHDRSDLRLVFLNACEGAVSGRRDSFAGVAQQLVQQGVPAVVAMQFLVSDRAATILSREFYRALAAGYPVDAALSEARKAIFGLGDTLEWATPVLFSRSQDNRLIELPQGDRRPVIERQPFEPETVFIPAGPFLMGSADPSTPTAEQPQHTVHLPALRMGKRPVTVREYAAFIKDRKTHPAPQGWFNREPPPDRLDAPVTDVSWFDALAWCAWLSERTGRRYTLPSEAEWERACGQDGVEAMLGSVQQWTRCLWGRQPQQPDFAYPYDPGDGREVTDPATLPAQARLVHRGGSFKSKPEELRAAARGNALPNSQIAWRGFRVVMQIP